MHIWLSKDIFKRNHLLQILLHPAVPTALTIALTPPFHHHLRITWDTRRQRCV